MRVQLQKAMEQAFNREFRDMISSVTYTRAATDGVYDPVNETYTGGTNAVTASLEGLMRKVDRRLVDGDIIFNDDMMFTTLQSKTTIVPQENDILDSKWRVLKIEQDVAGVFYNIFVRSV